MLQKQPYTWLYSVLSCMSPTPRDLGCLSPSSSTWRQFGGMWVSLRQADRGKFRCCTRTQGLWMFSPFQSLIAAPRVWTKHLFSPWDPQETPWSNSPKELEFTMWFSFANGPELQKIPLHESSVNNTSCCPGIANARQGPSCNFLPYSKDSWV